MNKNKLFGILGAVIVIIIIVLIVKNGGGNSADNIVVPSTSDTAKEYTLEEVAVHNTKADCWTTVDGGVYNLTSWISEHPGGQQAILSLCGIDGTAAFTAQHGGQKNPAAELASLKVGNLVAN